MCSMGKDSRSWFVLAVCVALFGTMTASAQVFVVPDGAGNEDGTSWGHAYGDLAAALSDGRAAAEDVWVAAGTYQVRSLQWPTDVAAYGGFAGMETALGQRNIAANETILSGGNEERVIWAEGGGVSNFRIDGFTLTNAINAGEGPFAGGFAGSVLVFAAVNNTNTVANCRIVDNGPGTHGNVFLQNAHVRFENCVIEDNNTSGITAGILVNDGSQPVIIGCTFRDNGLDGNSWGGPIAVRGPDSLPTIIDCHFEVNRAHQGGGIHVRENNAGANITGCTFIGNTADHGGAIAIWASETGVVNVERCILSGNSITGHGGAVAVHNSNAQHQFINCVIEGNQANGIGNALFAWGGESITTFSYSTLSQNDGPSADLVRADGTPAFELNNCLVWDNTPSLIRNTVSVSNSIIEGGYMGGYDLDPLFVDAAGGDLRLMPDSPAIDAGTEPFPATDILGTARPQGDGPDGGAYEFVPFDIRVQASGRAVLGDDVVLSVSLDNVYESLMPVSYQWFFEGEPIPGATGQQLQLTDLGEGHAGLYTVVFEIDGTEHTIQFNLNVASAMPVGSVVGLALAVLALVSLGVYQVMRRKAVAAV